MDAPIYSGSERVIEANKLCEEIFARSKVNDNLFMLDALYGTKEYAELRDSVSHSHTSDDTNFNELKISVINILSRKCNQLRSGDTKSQKNALESIMTQFINNNNMLSSNWPRAEERKKELMEAEITLFLGALTSIVNDKVKFPLETMLEKSVFMDIMKTHDMSAIEDLAVQAIREKINEGDAEQVLAMMKEYSKAISQEGIYHKLGQKEQEKFTEFCLSSSTPGIVDSMIKYLASLSTEKYSIFLSARDNELENTRAIVAQIVRNFQTLTGIQTQLTQERNKTFLKGEIETFLNKIHSLEYRVPLYDAMEGNPNFRKYVCEMMVGDKTFMKSMQNRGGLHQVSAIEAVVKTIRKKMAEVDTAEDKNEAAKEVLGMISDYSRNYQDKKEIYEALYGSEELNKFINIVSSTPELGDMGDLPGIFADILKKKCEELQIGDDVEKRTKAKSILEQVLANFVDLNSAQEGSLKRDIFEKEAESLIIASAVMENVFLREAINSNEDFKNRMKGLGYEAFIETVETEVYVHNHQASYVKPDDFLDKVAKSIFPIKHLQDYIDSLDSHSKEDVMNKIKNNESFKKMVSDDAELKEQFTAFETNILRNKYFDKMVSDVNQFSGSNRDEALKRAVKQIIDDFSRLNGNELKKEVTEFLLVIAEIDASDQKTIFEIFDKKEYIDFATNVCGICIQYKLLNPLKKFFSREVQELAQAKINVEKLIKKQKLEKPENGTAEVGRQESGTAEVGKLKKDLKIPPLNQALK